MYLVLILPMRNGNFLLLTKPSNTICVLILPMRNGNDGEKLIFAMNGKQFLSYLWGMETIDNRQIYARWTIVLILPMRNGNFTASYASLKYSSKVLILPMRNGNHIVPSFFVFFLYFVLILPMRNGNVPTSPTLTTLSSFLSYLWGMETLTFPKYLSVL